MRKISPGDVSRPRPRPSPPSSTLTLFFVVAAAAAIAIITQDADVVEVDDDILPSTRTPSSSSSQPTFKNYRKRRLQSISPPRKLYTRTPLVHSRTLSQRVGIPVYLKLEALQATGSFKDRGLSEYLRHLRDDKGVKRVISSSGGNAGHAAAWAGNLLGLNVTVVVPESAPNFMVDKIRSHGAEVIVHGREWANADKLVRQMVDDDPESAYVTPFDHPVIWKGHKTIIDEIIEDHRALLSSNSAVVCCVGGGGMLAGIYEGLIEGNCNNIKVITAETQGASSFAQSVHSGRRVKLPSINTVASTLGAPQVAEGVINLMREHEGDTVAIGDVSDTEAVQACINFSNDHRLLVEPSCGAALSIVYNDRHHHLLKGLDSIVVIVCGGGGVNMDVLKEYQTQLMGT